MNVIAAVPEVPFLADIRRGTVLTDEDPYDEVTRYLKVHRDQVETVFRTLSFVDVALPVVAGGEAGVADVATVCLATAVGTAGWPARGSASLETHAPSPSNAATAKSG